MKIIEITPLENGAHRNQTTSGRLPVPDGWAVIPEGMAIPDTFPFVSVETENGVVTALTAGTMPPVPDPEPKPPTTDERVAKLENENKLLREQVSAQADQAEFYEECIAEIAAIVYA